LGCTGNKDLVLIEICSANDEDLSSNKTQEDIKGPQISLPRLPRTTFFAFSLLLHFSSSVHHQILPCWSRLSCQVTQGMGKTLMYPATNLPGRARRAARKAEWGQPNFLIGPWTAPLSHDSRFTGSENYRYFYDLTDTHDLTGSGFPSHASVGFAKVGYYLSLLEFDTASELFDY